MFACGEVWLVTSHIRDIRKPPSTAASLPGVVANLSFNVELLQDEAASGKVLPAEYEACVEDSSGRAVSNRARVFADIELADASRHVIKVRIDLLTSVSFDVAEAYRLVARNVRTGEHKTVVIWRRPSSSWSPITPTIPTARFRRASRM